MDVFFTILISESDFDVPQTACFVNYTKKRFCAPKSEFWAIFSLFGGYMLQNEQKWSKMLSDAL